MPRARLVSSMALFLMLASRLDAATLHGLIFLNEVGGQPMAGVQVGAVGVSQTISDTSGCFRLDFPTRQPGDTVTLTVHKDGYVVVNAIQLEYTLPSHPMEKPIQILLSTEPDREKMACQFYRLANRQAIEDEYQRRVKELEAAKTANAAELAQLRQERDQALNLVDQNAEEIARIKPNAILQQFYQLQNRRTNKGLTVVASETDRLREDKPRRDGDQMLTLASEGAATVSRINPEEMARLSEDAQRLFLDGKIRESLTITRMLAKINLGSMDEARTACQATLVVCRDLAAKKPDAYLPDVAITLNTLGNLLTDQNHMDEAGAAYKEALALRRTLATTNPDTYLPDVASTLSSLGNLLGDQKRTDEARAALTESLTLYEQFAKQDPEQFEPCVKTVKRNLAELDAPRQ